jgi:hypothetical protein
MFVMKNFKRILGLSLMLTVGAGLASASAFVQTSVLDSWLSGTGAGSNVTHATIANLNGGTYGSVGGTITAGVTTINIVAVGDICFNGLGQTPSACAAGNQVAVNGTSVIAYFADGSGTLISSGQSDASTVPNSINGDFFIPIGGGLNILVPSTATQIFLAYNDSYYPDNSDTNNNFGVNISFVNNATVPEPATYGLMIAGLGGLLALKRFRRS